MSFPPTTHAKKYGMSDGFFLSKIFFDKSLREQVVSKIIQYKSSICHRIGFSFDEISIGKPSFLLEGFWGKIFALSQQTA